MHPRPLLQAHTAMPRFGTLEYRGGRKRRHSLAAAGGTGLRRGRPTDPRADLVTAIRAADFGGQVLRRSC